MALILGTKSSLAGQLTPFVETVPVTSDGQTVFVISSAPQSQTTVQMFVNGVAYVINVDFSVDGASVTWNNVDFEIGIDDTLLFIYDI